MDEVNYNTDRIIWIDTIKCICIFFVMLSHLGENKIAEGLRLFYNPFFLVGFLFASGYVYKGKKNFFEHIHKKTKQLLVPWFIISTLNIVLTNIVSFNPEKHLGLYTELTRNLLQVRGYGDGMWFVCALFVAYIPFYFIVKKYEQRKNNKILLIMCIILYLLNAIYYHVVPCYIFPWGGESNCLPWHLEYIPYALCFMLLGYMYKSYYEEKISEFINKKILFLCIAYIVLLFVKIKNFYIQTILMFVLNCLGLLIIIVIAKKMKFNKIISFIGKNTLMYFGFHGHFITLWEAILKFYCIDTEWLYSPVISIVYSLFFGVILSMLLIIPAKIVNKYFPFVVGKT